MISDHCPCRRLPSSGPSGVGTGGSGRGFGRGLSRLRGLWSFIVEAILKVWALAVVLSLAGGLLAFTDRLTSGQSNFIRPALWLSL